MDHPHTLSLAVVALVELAQVDILLLYRLSLKQWENTGL